MTGTIASLLKDISTPSEVGTFLVRRLSPGSPYYVGRDSAGSAALFIASTGQGRSVPLRLAGIEARFSVPCRIAEPNAPEETQTLTVILCISREPGVEGYFAGVLEALVANLGSVPTARSVGDAVDQLVNLFQKLQAPAKRSLAGLVGELCYLLLVADPVAAIAAWRADPYERFDFVGGNLRLDVKASTTRGRSHDISFEQANVPTGTRGLFASLWIEPAAGGVSINELLAMIEQSVVSAPTAVAKLRSVVADTLGSTLPVALDWRFDLQLAKTSLSLFDATTVPAVRAALPVGVSAVRFASDFARVPPLMTANFARDTAEIGLLPAQTARNSE